MSYDYLASIRSEALYDAWVEKLFQQEVLREIGLFMKKHRGGVAKELCNPVAGGFNACLQMIFGDGGSAMIRFPQPGNIRFPEEKVRKEVAIMRYIADKTSLPVPFVLHYGMEDEGPAGMGPFILMDYIKHAHNLTAELNTPGFKREDRPILNPDVPEEKLRLAYSEMAGVLLQLSQPSFAQIGSLEEVEDGSWTVTDRPLTFNMNDLVSVGNFPPSKLLATTFKTSSSYFLALADMNLVHLSTQRNDAITSGDDCRYKYIARHLFRRLVSEGKFPGSSERGPKPFKLFCDDLRPSNVLVDEDCRIVGVIDWEFTYAAPAEYSYSPPWWLLIETPEKWPGGIADWVQAYAPKLRIFLEVLKEREDTMIRDEILTEDQRLSARMKESWENGDFWVSYAMRNSWAFDAIFWEKINTNPRFYHKSGYEEGLKLLSVEERDGMEDFVRRKLEEAKARILDDWDKEEAESHMGGWI
ncbi:phosphotransferase family protein [Stipitochalara longipes BDJ]|nr:phosphotransferase family protein [Stipitochalara longipes BDJ]